MRIRKNNPKEMNKVMSNTGDVKTFKYYNMDPPGHNIQPEF